MLEQEKRHIDVCSSLLGTNNEDNQLSTHGASAGGGGNLNINMYMNSVIPQCNVSSNGKYHCYVFMRCAILVPLICDTNTTIDIKLSAAVIVTRGRKSTR